ncbi:hypothetical protein BDV98DRAFT_560682 [Pterulicium gracile]|uniref:Magnesium transporter NIPA-domain-containing protein n=1 Tax=Pterulicium gracile TaxID=1884261 RepID=A0A5C3QWQ3_9AGAR|nr:hypothetical protein BDV98DRAFT_560682 [Pterula gracilis]
MADNDEHDHDAPAHHLNPVIAFIIGLAIILLASVLNAAGLNITKLDHVRTSAIPKSARRKDWQRPLWLLGMVLYILSQLIGSTLALEYMRAEYVAPLGSSSLVFNFLFARFLVGTPVTSTDIYGTIVVILGVIGIVAFGSINSGLATETDVNHLTSLWRRGGWLAFFFASSFIVVSSIVFVSTLDAVLTSRSDLSSVPFASMRVRAGRENASPGAEQKGFFKKLMRGYKNFIIGLGENIESWTGAQDDRTLAWALGIGWACIGGGLAGGTLVFAKATVKLVSGSVSHENPGNQFGHVAPIFTIILLALTAVLQIICLNRGLKVYDSTLVVPVFYGVYTATGFLNSLIFNNEVDAYKPWVLFLIFLSIAVLISGVVLLTHKKPDHATSKSSSAGAADGDTHSGKDYTFGEDDDAEELHTLRAGDGDQQQGGSRSRGNRSVFDLEAGDEDADHHQNPNKLPEVPRGVSSTVGASAGEEGRGLMSGPGGVGRSMEDSSMASVFGEVTPVEERDPRNPFRDEEGEEPNPFRDQHSSQTGRAAESRRDRREDAEEFGEWADAPSRDYDELPTPRQSTTRKP